MKYPHSTPISFVSRLLLTTSLLIAPLLLLPCRGGRLLDSNKGEHPTTKNLPYRDASLPVDTRVSDLIGRMTLHEKLGQLRCELGWEDYAVQGHKVVASERFKKDFADLSMGMLWATFRADPWTRKSLTNGLTPRLAAQCANALQQYAITHSRLGIPLFLAEEAPHGHMAIGTTVFPTGLGLAATWDTGLMQHVGQVIGKEVRLQGAHISYGPILDVCRDPRWSRIEENMGEDPVLIASMAASEVKGLGGGRLSEPYATIATLKHFVGYGLSEGGHNGGPTLVGMHETTQYLLPPFRRAVEAGALSLMTSYNSIDGLPTTCNEYLLTDVLRKKWNFRGFVVSDLYSIDGIAGARVAHDLSEAGAMAVKAGCDVDLGGRSLGSITEQQMQADAALGAAIDSTCARVLRLKFEMGLFEHPYVDPEQAAAEVRSKEHIAVARKAALESVTLLKNDGALPLKNKNLKVALVGPNADNVYNMLGDYTAPQERSNVKTVLDGMRRHLKESNIYYVKGCAIRDTTTNDIEAAVAAARKADVVVACVGGSSARDFKTSYEETGAASTSSATLSDMESGEGFDRATLGLMGLQERLLKALRLTGKPLVVVYIEGRPLLKNWAAEHANALLTAFYPGQEGGDAIADVLFGDYNPAGRLPMSQPRDVGQLPVYYNRTSSPHDYTDMPSSPLYAFGYGLSYTTFNYSNLSITPLAPATTGHELSESEALDKVYRISFDVTNTGAIGGDEIPQIYLRDDYTSTVQPVMQLKAFDRQYIEAGTTRHFAFELTNADLSIINRQLQQVVEPGEFHVMVGASSDRILLRGEFTVNSK